MLQQNLKNHFQQIILYSYIQLSGLLALTLVLNSVLHSHRTVQFWWALTIHLHPAIITCATVRHTLSRVWAVESPLSATQKSRYPLYAHCLAMRRFPHYPMYDHSDCPAPAERWSYIALSHFARPPHSSRQCYLSLSLEGMIRFSWCVPLTRKHWHSGSGDVRGFASCLTDRCCYSPLQYISKTNLMFQILGGSCLYNFY